MTTCLLCERHDATGGQLCPGCTKDTIVRLEALPVLYRALAAFLAPAATGGQGRSGTRAHAPLPVAELPLTMRGPGGMAGVTEDWLSAVRTDRGMTEPRPVGAVEARLGRAVAGLIANMPWIAVSWPLAGSFAEEIRDLTNAARSVVAPRDRPDVVVVRLGLCPAMTDAGVCGAVLNRHPGESVVTCDWCSTSYPSSTWSGLKVLMDQDAKAASGVV